MLKSKKAFTMIELIFVIVIIGILAAVAVPRLSATRDDAKIVKSVANLRTFVMDVKSYYATNGESTITNPEGSWIGATTPITYADVTDTIPKTRARAVQTGNNGVLQIDGETGVSCFQITEGIRVRNLNGQNINQRVLTVATGTGIDPICISARLVAEDKGLYDPNNDIDLVFAGQYLAF